VTNNTHTSTPCPACGSELSQDPGSAGLCPGCILELALESPSLMAELEAEGEAPTQTYSPEGFSPGQVLGRRYRIRSLVGRGGMGEVWRATDLKLRVDVALKSLRLALVEDARALETLRQEVRVAREVVSPNVCRVYDLIELDGQELVSMEYIDGITLLDILRMRAPLELSEARDIASQFLAGLEAIHEAGLVHRDVKPENLMMTRSGRVVLMDFGLAKGLTEERTGSISGTPGYMSPEQARGEDLDARADVYAAGVVLAEMVAPGGLRSFEARQRIWRDLQQQPPRLPDSPWAPVLGSAIATQREQRPASAAALARALDEVTLRIAGDDEARPYPGLSAFTEDDAEYFFGRELEIEAMWRRLQRPHLLGLIGPSGAGKSSFLRAGLLPVMPTGWRALVVNPGSEPFSALARALVPELTHDTEALQLLTRRDDDDGLLEAVRRWRHQHAEVLLVFDQFEELFTQNPSEQQARFAELLGRLAVETDSHILLSMRDDFLFHCQRFEALAPLFSEMTPLGPPTGSALRRALVQPALKCGYKFDNEALVDEMIGEVADERGALPLLAFATARLWEHRDRGRGLLTREAYEHIGGVGGALAQHAETTLERIGLDQIPIVRELFRNLVTSQGTRAARDRKDLLSVFEAADGPARRVLDALIDARLLTSYEVSAADDGGEPSQQVEIIHESLLSNWPRLVRWQTQDADSAQLRDQLRQAAQMWIDRGKPDDLLWTGTSLGEYQLWRQRYEGGLSSSEEDFGRAMTERAERSRRRRRLAVAALVTAALLVAAVTGGLWLRSEAEARRAEAAKLLAIAQLQFEADPTEALAYTVASLELADTSEARVFALKILQEVPPALVLDSLGESSRLPAFSGSGRWFAAAGHAADVFVFERGGAGPVRLPDHKASPRGHVEAAWLGDRYLVTGHWTAGRARIWSFPEGRLEREIDFGAPTSWQVGTGHLLAETIENDSASGHEIHRLRKWSLPGGQPEELGTVDATDLGLSQSFFDPGGNGWYYANADGVFYRATPLGQATADRLIAGGSRIAWRPSQPDRIWIQRLGSGDLELWDLAGSRPRRNRALSLPSDHDFPTQTAADSTGRWVATMKQGGSSDGISLWDLDKWPGARTLNLRRQASWYGSIFRFDPTGKWLAASVASWDQDVFWPVIEKTPAIVDGYTSGLIRPLTFTSDSQWLATTWSDRSLRLWPLPGNPERGTPVLLRGETPGLVAALAFDPDGGRLAGTGMGGQLFLFNLDKESFDALEGFSDDHALLLPAAFSPSGSLVAAGTSYGTGIEKTLRVWNLETGGTQVLDLEQTRPREFIDADGGAPDAAYAGGIASLAFQDESTLYSAGLAGAGVIRWDLETAAWERIVEVEPDQHTELWLSQNRQSLLTAVAEGGTGGGGCRDLVVHDLASGVAQKLENFPNCDSDVALVFDPSFSVQVATRADGLLRAGRVGGGEPHLLIGHEGPIDQVAISSDLRWIASTGEDNTLRLWPMPDLDQPPLHALPHTDLLTKLRSLTNLRAVRDGSSSTGWRIEIGPFPGWEEIPGW
jgi:WD40 repeat protein